MNGTKCGICYYRCGPLKRTELGEHLQGTDYVYTLQGWLKSINSPDAAERDPGGDAMDEGVNAAFAPDLFGMALDYFDGDYARAGVQVQSNPEPPAVTPYTDRYTGLVRAQRWNNRALDDDETYRFGGQALMYWYGYDKLGQLTSAQLGTVASTLMDPGAVVGLVHDYKVWNLSYDLNGNLLTLNRNGQQPVSLAMDQLTYHYSVDGNGNKLHNRTHKVTDAQSTTAYDNTYQLPAGQGTNNYNYNAIGQLEGDALEDRHYTYYASGRVKEVFSNSDMTLLLASFTYDGGGNRLCKTSYASNGTTSAERTWYFRDAGGALLSYTMEDVEEETFSEELPVPGVGSYMRTNEQVRYEIADHLGNTRVSFTADEEGVLNVVEAHDYYPHGGLLPGRQLTSSAGSPLAYQGQEYDAEVNLTAFNLRQYDARLGRWQTPDPYGQHYSPFLAMSNNPVMHVDPDGGLDMFYIDGLFVPGSAIHHFLEGAERSGRVFDMEMLSLDQYDRVAYQSTLSDVRIKNGSIMSARAREAELVGTYHATTYRTDGGGSAQPTYTSSGISVYRNPWNGALFGAQDGGTALVFNNYGSLQGLSDQAEAIATERSAFHDEMDVLGLVPALGEPADAINTLSYIKEGRLSDAGTSLLATIPVAGMLVTGGKWLRRSERAADATRRGAVVIGENMDRVDRYASGIGAETFQGVGMEANRMWIREAKLGGKQVIDIGPDFARRVQRIEMGLRPDSKFYNMERMETSGYENYLKAFERRGKYTGGTP